MGGEKSQHAHNMDWTNDLGLSLSAGQKKRVRSVSRGRNFLQQQQKLGAPVAPPRVHRPQPVLGAMGLSQRWWTRLVLRPLRLAPDLHPGHPGRAIQDVGTLRSPPLCDCPRPAGGDIPSLSLWSSGPSAPPISTGTPPGGPTDRPPGPAIYTSPLG